MRLLKKLFTEDGTAAFPRDQARTSDNCGCNEDRDDSCCLGARDEGWTGARAVGCAQTEAGLAGLGTMVGALAWASGLVTSCVTRAMLWVIMSLESTGRTS